MGKQIVSKFNPKCPPTTAEFAEFGGDKYSLQEWKEIFLEERDPYEYKFAMRVLGDWEVWCKFKSRWPKFRNEILPVWKEELMMKLNSEYFQTALTTAKTNDKNFASLKWILEGKYDKVIAEAPQEGKEAAPALSRAERLAQKEDEEELAKVKQAVKLKINNDRP